MMTNDHRALALSPEPYRRERALPVTKENERKKQKYPPSRCISCWHCRLEFLGFLPYFVSFNLFGLNLHLEYGLGDGVYLSEYLEFTRFFTLTYAN